MRAYLLRGDQVGPLQSARAVRSAVRTRCPPAASVRISRETVGSDATGPNTAGSARSMPTSVGQSPPSATASDGIVQRGQTDQPLPRRPCDAHQVLVSALHLARPQLPRPP